MITPSFGLTATERVLPRLALDWTTGVAQPGVDVTRSGVATYVDSDGLIKSADPNTQRVDYSTGMAGLLVEESRTNLTLYSSDLTQTNWVLNSLTAAKTATGPDGVANSATTLTASAGYAVAQQKITSASAARTASAYLKRRTGNITNTVLISHGEETGSNIVVNGDFATGDDTGWTINPANGWAVTSNQLVCTNSPTNTNYVGQTITGLTVGKMYVLRVTVSQDTNPTRGGYVAILEQGFSSGVFVARAWAPADGLGTFYVPFIASESTLYLGIWQRTSCIRTYDDFEIFELVTEDVTSEIESGWYRAVMPSSTFANPMLCIGVRSGEIDVYGAQSEVGAFATSYIPTEATAVTRNADVATMTGTNFSDWFNATEGTFKFIASSAAATGLASVPHVFSVNDGTASNRIRTFLYANASGQVTVSGASQATLSDALLLANNTFYNATIGYKENNFGFSLNGRTPIIDTSGTLPTVTQTEIGSQVGAGFLNGHIQKLLYWKQKLTSAELQAFSKE
jgi:hypothetical protein